MTVYVLRWNYYDRSAWGIVRVYEDSKTADEECAFLKEHAGGKEWRIDAVPLVKRRP